jgi:hypothetical protein
MWQDPVVAETRQLREELASRFGHDARSIFEEMVRRQGEAGRTVASFPPRRPLTPSVSVPPVRQAG